MTDEQMKHEIAQITDGLPCLDTRSALNLLGGSPSMYLSFLTRFYDEYSDSGEKLAGLLSGKELIEAHRLVHSMKSLAGNLGAAELHHSALRLESDMKRGLAMPSEKEVGLFTRELSNVLNELNTFLQSRAVKQHI